jgi:hypothetical protein
MASDALLFAGDRAGAPRAHAYGDWHTASVMRRAMATRLAPARSLVITEVVLRHTVAYRSRERIIGYRSRVPKHILLRLLGVQTASTGLVYATPREVNSLHVAQGRSFVIEPSILYLHTQGRGMSEYIPHGMGRLVICFSPRHVSSTTLTLRRMHAYEDHATVGGLE